MSDLAGEYVETARPRSRSWRYFRNLCIAIVLTLAIFNATVTPTAQAEGTFEPLQTITTAVLIFAVTLTTMLSVFQTRMEPPSTARPAVYHWHTGQTALASLTTATAMLLILMTPIVLMAKSRQRAGLAAVLLLTTAIALTAPFSIPPSVAYSN